MADEPDLPRNWGDSAGVIPKTPAAKIAEARPEHPAEELNLLSDHDLDAIADRVIDRLLERFPMVARFAE